MLKCPECESDNTGDLDCDKCLCAGVVIDDLGDEVSCPDCDGDGFIEGHHECLNCGEVFCE